MALLSILKSIFKPSPRVTGFMRKLKGMPRNMDILLRHHNYILIQLAKSEINYYLEDTAPTFPGLKSQLCTFEQMSSPQYLHWCKESNYVIGTVKNRKEWEYCYILQALQENNMIKPGSKGLGFAVGLEPLPSMLVSKGCRVLATDLDLSLAKQKGWAEGQVQHAQKLQDLNQYGVCDQELFKQNGSFRVVNMNSIPPDLQDFDFLWSSCSLEHLGSIDAGIRFILNAMQCLKPGGVAVHTTEFNLSSNFITLDNQDTVLFRKRDILRLNEELDKAGYRMAPLTFNAGGQPEDQYIDIPPYKQFGYHLKLLLEQYVTTSIGLIIYKPMP